MNRGEQVRREVMGDEFVDKALKGANELTRPMQALLNDACWGTVWASEESVLDRKTRSLVTIGMLAALKAPQELKGHVRGALNNGASIEEVRDVLLHSLVYCGAPACQEAFRAAREVLDPILAERDSKA